MTMLGTSRHTLRPPTSSDVDVFHSIWGDPEVIWWGESATLEETRDLIDGFLARTADRPGLGWWLVVLNETGEVIGDVAVEPSPLPDAEIEIGWHFKRAHWGAGHATEAADAALQHAFEAGVPDIVATIVPSNTRSIAVAERLGLRRRPGVFERVGLTHGVWTLRP